MRIGVVGGGFRTQFYWHVHPHCTVAAVSDDQAASCTLSRHRGEARLTEDDLPTSGNFFAGFATESSTNGLPEPSI